MAGNITSWGSTTFKFETQEGIRKYIKSEKFKLDSKKLQYILVPPCVSDEDLQSLKDTYEYQ
jgi:hypothetical protein